MRLTGILAIFLILSILLSGCTKPAKDDSDDTNLGGKLDDSNVKIPNPAAKKCETEGHTYETRESADGGQFGVCIFSDGSICKAWDYFKGECHPRSFSEIESKKTAEEFILNTETYKFDGSKLAFKEMNPLDCIGCYEFIYSFESSQAGYGNRTGESLAQVLTPHMIVVMVEQDKVTYALIDEKWDSIEQKLLDDLLTGDTIDDSAKDTKDFVASKVEIANPASKYCIDRGYRLEVKKDENGNWKDLCIFPNRTSCEEWKFFRGECENAKLIEQENFQIAENFILNSETYNFHDSFGLELVNTEYPKCVGCYDFTFEYASTTLGFGKNVEEPSAQETYSHSVLVNMVKGEITWAIVDKQWDEIVGQEVDQ